MFIFNKEEILKKGNIISLFFIEHESVFLKKIKAFALHVSPAGLSNWVIPHRCTLRSLFLKLLKMGLSVLNDWEQRSYESIKVISSEEVYSSAWKRQQILKTTFSYSANSGRTHSNFLYEFYYDKHLFLLYTFSPLPEVPGKPYALTIPTPLICTKQKSHVENPVKRYKSNPGSQTGPFQQFFFLLTVAFSMLG